MKIVINKEDLEAHVVDLLQKIPNNKLYREFQVDYENFSNEVESDQSEIDASGLIDKAKPFFKKNGLLLNWKEFEKLNQTQKINTLSMIAPITNEEKQKLLEAISLESKVRTLESIFSFYLHETSFNNFTIQ